MYGARIHAAILALVTATSVWAMDSPKPEPKKDKDPAMEQARAAIAKEDWTRAQGVLREAVARNPQDADAHNLYAYSLRKGPNPQMDVVFRHYNEALRIDPKHRAAHEYLGEAYLQVGKLELAEQELKALVKICFFSCEEYRDLKEEIARYKREHPRSASLI